MAETSRLRREHSYGPDDAPVVITEYGDFECPYCGAAAPVLRELVDSGEGRVRLVFRSFPLFDVHPHALTAALAAEAAGAQGQFWAMHDLLFAHQDRLADQDLAGYAESLGIDGRLVVGDAAQRYADDVEADYADGLAAGVQGTPTLFVDGERYSGKVSLVDLRAVLVER